MSKGQKRDGNYFPDYSERSVKVFGKQPGPWTLKDTGAFYQGLTVIDVNAKGWTLTSTDDKTPLLLKKAGKLMFGLNDETRAGGASNPPLAEIILPALKDQMQQQTGLKF